MCAPMLLSACFLRLSPPLVLIARKAFHAGLRQHAAEQQAAHILCKGPICDGVTAFNDHVNFVLVKVTRAQACASAAGRRGWHLSDLVSVCETGWRCTPPLCTFR